MNSLNKLFSLLKTISPEFDESKVSVSEPKIMSPDSSGNNTQIVLRAREGSGYIGNKPIQYKRLELTRLFEGINPSLDGTNDSLDNIVKVVNDTYGTDFHQDDFEVTRNDTEVTITARANNYKYIGEITMPIATHLESLFTRNPNGFEYNSLERQVLDAHEYSASITDISSAYVKALNTASQLNTALLARILKLITGDQWVSSEEPANFNLYNARITNSNYFTENEQYIQTVDIELDADKSKQIKGTLQLRFPALLSFPATHYTNYDKHRDNLLLLKEGDVTSETAAIINNIIRAKNLVVDDTWEIVYNGSIDNIPDEWVEDVAQNKANVCLVISKDDASLEHVVLSYN